jgi:hypothetical protein
MTQADESLRLIGLEELAPVDEGFLDSAGRPAQPFHRGQVRVLPGADHMDLSALQSSLTASERLRSMACILLAAGSGVGLFYLLGKLTLVRNGELALVRSVTGECRALGSGWHLINTVGCQVQKASMTDPLVQLGNLSIIRIFPGSVGLGQLNGKPLLLAPGVHLINDALFCFKGTAAMTQPHITVENVLHIITVPKGMLGLCTADAQGHFLGPGRHAINHQRFEFRGLRHATEEYLCTGSKHRVLISAGRLGLAWEAGRPLVLEPKDEPLFFDSPTFRWERSVSASQQVILHGSSKIVTVRQGFVGVSFRDGALDVLPPGRQILALITHVFAGFLPTGQNTLMLEKVISMT